MSDSYEAVNAGFAQGCRFSLSLGRDVAMALLREAIKGGVTDQSLGASRVVVALMAQVEGADHAECLRRALAYDFNAPPSDSLAVQPATAPEEASPRAQSNVSSGAS